MDRGNTKQEILDVALELFSRQGYEATSISSIADAVGIRKASLYSHFSSKQAILDEIVKIVLEQYDAHSLVLKNRMANMPYILKNSLTCLSISISISSSFSPSRSSTFSQADTGRQSEAAIASLSPFTRTPASIRL